jgi:Flp pilus assembly protein TadG
MRAPDANDGGSATAEFAIVVPAILVVLGVILAAMGMGRDSIAYTSLANQAARSIARGEDVSTVRARIERFAPHAQLTIDQSSEVCVTVTSSTPPRQWWNGARPSGFACAPREA